MVSMNNPAGRLYSILEKGNRIDQNIKIQEAWAKLLETPQDNLPLLFQRVGCVVALPAQIKEEILAQTGINHEAHLRWLPQVEKAMKQLNFAAQWKAFDQHITDATILGLEICDDVLSRKSPVDPLKDKDLREIHSEVGTLYDDVLKADIPTDVRLFLLRHLKNLNLTMLEYRLTGVLPIEASISAAVGEAVINRDIAERSKTSEHGQKFWEMLGRVAVLLAALNGAFQLTDSVVKYFPLVAPAEQPFDGVAIKDAEVTESAPPRGVL